MLIFLPIYAVSLALKFHYEQTQVTRSARLCTWYDKFIKNHAGIILTDTVIEDLVDGMEFERLLDLPKELYFNINCLTDLVVSERCIRPFRHLE